MPHNFEKYQDFINTYDTRLLSQLINQAVTHEIPIC